MAVLEIRRVRPYSTPKLYINGVWQKVGSPDFSTGRSITALRRWKRGKEKFYVVIDGKRIPFNMIERGGMSPASLLDKYARFLKDREADLRYKERHLAYTKPYMPSPEQSFGARSYGGLPDRYARFGRSW